MPSDVFTPSDDEMAMIHEELRKIESGNNVKVLFAVESGSRSWGMASKNSDYDVRFVYKRPIYDYLRLDQRKDTLDWHPDPMLDMVWWDVSKYLSLLHRSNPSALEWLNCPRYVVSDPSKLHAIDELAETCFKARSLAFHYIGMARENANEFLRIANGVTRDEPPKTKKYLYVVRALLSARHVIDNLSRLTSFLTSTFRMSTTRRSARPSTTSWRGSATGWRRTSTSESQCLTSGSSRTSTNASRWHVSSSAQSPPLGTT